MSSASGNEGNWRTWLKAPETSRYAGRPDDPRLGSIIEMGFEDLRSIPERRAALIGFPQDEGVRRNQGRSGAARAPATIRHWLYRLTPFDGVSGADLAERPPIDVGDVRLSIDLEATQQTLASVVAALVSVQAIPIVLGGGHETALGHYLGHASAGRPVGIINLDAHLDVRACIEGLGHSGSPFRQMLEHPIHPLAGTHYACVGAQPWAVSRDHLAYAEGRGCRVRWASEVRDRLQAVCREEYERLAAAGCVVYVSLDANVVRMADVPGVSAPNPAGLDAGELAECCRVIGSLPAVAGFDVVEINPQFDVDDHSSRWAALAVWHFLCGLAARRAPNASRYR
jgi:formiminoglutamase